MTLIFSTHLAQFIALIFALLILRSIYYMYCYFLAKRYQSKYAKWVSMSNEDSDQSDGWYVKEHQQDIKKLLLFAGIKGRNVMVNEPIGWGQLMTGSFKHIDNIALRRRDVMEEIYADLREAVSVFWRKIFQSFNPFYWLEFIVFLPKHILNYLGLSSENVFVRLLQLIWWIFAAVGTVIGYWNNDFWNYLRTIL